jgi:ADP-ribosyl-[dinitrogen reductase] hydrolase
MSVNVNDEVVKYSALSSLTTHGAREAVECCQLLGLAIARCLAETPKREVLDGVCLGLTEPRVLGLAVGQYLNKGRDEIRGSG